MPKATETVLEINLKALEHNYRYLKSKLKTSTKFMAVVKAFGYGSDAVEVSKKLVKLNVDYLAVAYVKEGVALREGGIKTPILVLHPQAVNFETLIEYELEPSLYSPKILNAFLQVAQKQNIAAYPIHIKFNTGLNRLGFGENDVNYIAQQIEQNTSVKVASIFSHLAASEDAKEKEFTTNQITVFEKIAKEMDEKLGYTPLKHILNTSGIINYPEAQYDIVRSGIGLSGFGNDAAIDQELHPVATLKTIISQLHKIAPNESVGYNRDFKSDGEKVTATLPLGHADGIRRQYGNNKIAVSVNGKKAPIIGNVCMDMIMIDVTGIDCKEGDEVIVFGKNPTAEEFAHAGNTISYELLTGISQRVKRVYTNA